MKVSDLRNAKALVEQLDCIIADLALLQNTPEKRIVAKHGRRQLKYKPALDHYREYLEDCKLAIEDVLTSLGVDLNA